MRSLSRPSIEWFEALRALHALNRDHDDTAQVFRIIEALRGRSGPRALRRFRRSAVGARVLAERRSLVPVLSDRARLERLPDASLGRAYLAFMTARGISPEGLVEASSDSWGADDLARDERVFQSRSRDMHDLWHVAVGYGSDPLGELCLLGFTYAQFESPGTALIAALGALRYTLECRDARIARAVFEGYALGRRAAWLPAQDWERLLELPLEAVRAQLRLPPPARYLEALPLMPAGPPAAATPAA